MSAQPRPRPAPRFPRASKLGEPLHPLIPHGGLRAAPGAYAVIRGANKVEMVTTALIIGVWFGTPYFGIITIITSLYRDMGMVMIGFLGVSVVGEPGKGATSRSLRSA
jgi:hypothetical protein